jgi:hypothetical protein
VEPESGHLSGFIRRQASHGVLTVRSGERLSNSRRLFFGAELENCFFRPSDKTCRWGSRKKETLGPANAGGGDEKLAATLFFRRVRKRPFRSSTRRGGEDSCGGF